MTLKPSDEIFDGIRQGGAWELHEIRTCIRRIAKILDEQHAAGQEEPALASDEATWSDWRTRGAPVSSVGRAAEAKPKQGVRTPSPRSDRCDYSGMGVCVRCGQHRLYVDDASNPPCRGWGKGAHVAEPPCDSRAAAVSRLHAAMRPEQKDSSGSPGTGEGNHPATAPLAPGSRDSGQPDEIAGVSEAKPCPQCGSQWQTACLGCGYVFSGSVAEPPSPVAGEPAVWPKLMAELRSLAATHPATQRMSDLAENFEACGVVLQRHLAERKSKLTTAQSALEQAREHVEAMKSELHSIREMCASNGCAEPPADVVEPTWAMVEELRQRGVCLLENGDHFAERARLEEICESLTEANARWTKHEEICSGADEHENPNEADRLNPYKRSWIKQELPTGPLASFLHGIRYYAGMLEDDDNWSHGLGHIEELCVEFDKAIHERAGKPYLPRDERLRADLQSWFDAAQTEKKRAAEANARAERLESEREHLLFGCAESFVRLDAIDRYGGDIAVHQKEWLDAERIRMRATPYQSPKLAGEPVASDIVVGSSWYHRAYGWRRLVSFDGTHAKFAEVGGVWPEAMLRAEWHPADPPATPEPVTGVKF